MSVFRSFLLLESGRYFSKRNLLVFLLFWGLSLSFLQQGVNEYKNIISGKTAFSDVEKANAGKFINYSQYGLYGFRLLFVPSPLIVFFPNSGVVPELTAFVDSGVRLQVYYSVMGKNLYAEKSSSFMDFSGFVFLFGSLFAVFLGFNRFFYIEYIRHLCGILSCKRLFFFLVAERLMIITLLFVFLAGSALGVLTLNGILLRGSDFSILVVYGLLALLLLWFFFIIGTTAGSIKSKTNGIIVLAGLWFGFVFLVPGTISKITAKIADNITSTYKLEQEKLKILTDFEKKALHDTRRYDTVAEKKNSDKRYGESYWNNDFLKLQAIEKRMESESRRSFTLYRRLSLLTPTTFYMAAVNEIDSRGYANVIDFYAYVQRLKKDFTRFYFQKRFYSDYTGVESFVKNEENIFYARSRVPENLPTGLTVMLLYIVSLTVFGFYRFKRKLFFRPGINGNDDIKGLDVELKKGETYVLVTNGNLLKHRLYNFFHGEKKEPGDIVSMDNVSLNSMKNIKGKAGASVAANAGANGDANSEDIKKTEGLRFHYICHPGKIPGDMKCGHFISLVRKSLRISKKEMAALFLRLETARIEDKYFKQLSDAERGLLLLATAQLSKSDIYMLHNFSTGIPKLNPLIAGELLSIKEQGATVLYLTDDVLLATKIGDSAGSLLAPKMPKLATYNLV
ncbi:MAG: ABC transporter permease subunit [bacterium]|nr:ABC transporter permease subunit [bacterium]